MTETASFYVPEGDAFRATEHTRGPWSADHQHGGPPAALLARAIEKHAGDGVRVARISVVFHKPIAIESFRIAIETVREGKKVRLVRAQLVSIRDGRAVATADAVLVRRDAAAGAPETIRDALPAPDACASFAFSFFTADVGYHTAMEARHVAGTWGTGALTLWMRMRLPLVPDEEPSPLARVLAAADSGNGISAALDPARSTFVNPDLTVALAREPVGEWIALDATTAFGADGIGLADTRLADAKGTIGRGLQTLIVERRA